MNHYVESCTQVAWRVCVENYLGYRVSEARKYDVNVYYLNVIRVRLGWKRRFL